ncbi:MAG TPA: hypothetical protein ENJ52_03055 [Aliiroseovarius sp.]|nr:hypothetical protein [Aliiroseovarius sp.]
MRHLIGNRNLTLILLVLTIVTGYLGFRYFYGVSGDFPYSQEVLLVFIGAVVTVLITALLLNQQTELELRKEGQVLLLDRKSSIYGALIEHVGEIVEKGAMNAELYADLRVLNHKLAMIGSAPVIRHFNAVLDQLDLSMRDQSIAAHEQDQIMRAVATLTYHMRRDLLGQIGGEDDAEVLQFIQANNADLESDEAGV